MNASMLLTVRVVECVPPKLIESFRSTKPVVPLACRCHFTSGVGGPVAMDVNDAVPPTLAVALTGCVTITGGTPMTVSVKVCGEEGPDEFEAVTVKVKGDPSAVSGVPLNTGETNCK